MYPTKIKWLCGWAEKAPAALLARLAGMVRVDPIVVTDTDGTSHLYVTTVVEPPKVEPKDFGICEGETCWRDGCQGVLNEDRPQNCSCHINPPCGECTTNRCWCPECDWSGRDEEDSYHFNGYIVKDNPVDRNGQWEWYKPRPLDPRKIDYRSKGHSSSSMVKEGVYPMDEYPDTIAAMKAIRAECDGTFGGRFEFCRDGKFKFIAYTD